MAQRRSLPRILLGLAVIAVFCSLLLMVGHLLNENERLRRSPPRRHEHGIKPDTATSASASTSRRMGSVSSLRRATGHARRADAGAGPAALANAAAAAAAAAALQDGRLAVVARPGQCLKVGGVSSDGGCRKAGDSACGCDWAKAHHCKAHLDDGSACWRQCCCLKFGLGKKGQGGTGGTVSGTGSEAGPPVPLVPVDGDVEAHACGADGAADDPAFHFTFQQQENTETTKKGAIEGVIGLSSLFDQGKQGGAAAEGAARPRTATWCLGLAAAWEGARADLVTISVITEKCIHRTASKVGLKKAKEKAKPFLPPPTQRWLFLPTGQIRSALTCGRFPGGLCMRVQEWPLKGGKLFVARCDPNDPLQRFQSTGHNQCSSLPTSMNGDSNLRGCPGAVRSNHAGSPRHCSGDSGKYPWWQKCCVWDAASATCKAGPLRTVDGGAASWPVPAGNSGGGNARQGQGHGQVPGQIQSRALRVAFMVAFRDRGRHLSEFAPRVRKFFADYNSGKQRRDRAMIEPTFIVAEQGDTGRFNKGLLLNAAFDMAMAEGAEGGGRTLSRASSSSHAPSPSQAQSQSQSQQQQQQQQRLPPARPFDTVCLHDVDLVPLDPALAPLYVAAATDFAQNNTRAVYHVAAAFDCRLRAGNCAGGVLCMTPQAWRDINGAHNGFAGWGVEDDQMEDRIVAAGYEIKEPAGVLTKAEAIEVYVAMDESKRDVHAARFHITEAEGATKGAFHCVDAYSHTPRDKAEAMRGHASRQDVLRRVGVWNDGLREARYRVCGARQHEDTGVVIRTLDLLTPDAPGLAPACRDQIRSDGGSGNGDGDGGSKTGSGASALSQNLVATALQGTRDLYYVNLGRSPDRAAFMSSQLTLPAAQVPLRSHRVAAADGRVEGSTAHDVATHCAAQVAKERKEAAAVEARRGRRMPWLDDDDDACVCDGWCIAPVTLKPSVAACAISHIKAITAAVADYEALDEAARRVHPGFALISEDDVSFGAFTNHWLRYFPGGIGEVVAQHAPKLGRDGEGEGEREGEGGGWDILNLACSNWRDPLAFERGELFVPYHRGAYGTVGFAVNLRSPRIQALAAEVRRASRRGDQGGGGGGSGGGGGGGGGVDDAGPASIVKGSCHVAEFTLYAFRQMRGFVSTMPFFRVRPSHGNGAAGVFTSTISERRGGAGAQVAQTDLHQEWAAAAQWAWTTIGAKDGEEAVRGNLEANRGRPGVGPDHMLSATA
jgi:uncharacterized membrane protein YgcG